MKNMKVECIYYTLDEMRNGIEIRVDDTTIIDIYDGEPEDNNLFRNFGDCYNIVELIKMVYSAGKRNVELQLIETEVQYED